MKAIKMENRFFDADDWVLSGRGGHLLQFFATDVELQNWFLTALPAACGPYTLVGADSVRNNQNQLELSQ